MVIRGIKIFKVHSSPFPYHIPFILALVFLQRPVPALLLFSIPPSKCFIPIPAASRNLA